MKSVLQIFSMQLCLQEVSSVGQQRECAIFTMTLRKPRSATFVRSAC